MSFGSLSSSFAVHFDYDPLILIVEPAVVLSNNVRSFSPRTTFSLFPNSSNFVFYDIVANTLRLNTSGFPNQVIPIATVTTSEKRITSIVDNRPDFVVITPTTVDLVNTPGTPLAHSNFSLSGWGTGASLALNSGTQTGFSITMTAGTTPSQQPTVTLTFNIFYTNPPMTLARVTGGTGMFADILVSNTIAQSVLTYDGIPVSGKTYTIMAFNLGQ